MPSSRFQVAWSSGFRRDSEVSGGARIDLVSRFGMRRVARRVPELAILAGLMLLLALTPALAVGPQEEPMNILWQVPGKKALANIDLPVEEAEPFVKRVGAVVFDADWFLPRSLATGKRAATAASLQQRALVLDFFPDRRFSVIVGAESRPRPGVMTLNARVEGDDIDTLSLTVTAESYLLTLQDLHTATVYRVVGDTETGVGEVTEIDLRSMPPILYSPPITPPGR